MLAIDYAWQHPAPVNVKSAGYAGVMRYLSHDNTKDVSVSEIATLHRAGLWIGLVFETVADRAGQGSKAGLADMREAEKRCKSLGYPAGCPIFYAVDFDARWADVAGYFTSVTRYATWPVGIYGGLRVVDAALASHHGIGYGWQTSAWSGGAVSALAHLYQRQHPTKAISGARGGWDENVVLHAFPAWSASPVTAPVKPPVPPVTPPAPDPDSNLVAAFHKWVTAKGLTG